MILVPELDDLEAAAVHVEMDVAFFEVREKKNSCETDELAGEAA